MKSLMVTAPSSNTGKTLISLGIIRSLKNRGKDVRAFKTGPDFLDTKLLSKASGQRAGNLDIHLMGSEGLRLSLSMNRGDYAIIEGAMGYFDGIYNTYENSSCHISKELGIPALLVYSPKGEMFSAIPKIKGMVDFKNSKIKGLILNNTKKHLYPLYKEQIEKYIGIKVLGYVEEDKELKIRKGPLGLNPYEKDLEQLLDRLGEKIEETVNINGLVELMEEQKIRDYKLPNKRRLRVAIAYDEAFYFYYNENLDLLEKICHVEYFSPLKDSQIPPCDLLYIGGGHPELYKEELSKNKTMLRSIRVMAEDSGFIYGEAGGMEYLSQSIGDYPMAGILPGKSYATNSLRRFGYTYMELMEDTILGRKGDIISAHEYHKSTMDLKGNIFRISKPKSKRRWKCGYRYKNVLASYGHINFLGNIDVLENLLNYIEQYKGEG